VLLHEGRQGYDVLGYTREQIIADELSHFQKQMHVLHVVT